MKPSRHHEISAQTSKNDEYNKLPDTQRRLTFRGRYVHQDKEVIRLAGIDKLPPGSDVTVLDFAGGVLEFGSPTAHDLIDSFEDIEQHASVTVVDKYIPENLEPNYPEVSYHASLDEIGEQQYDIVRVMHLVEHLSVGEYDELRQELVKHIKEGGLLVASQMIIYKYNYLTEEPRSFAPIVKVMQKRKGALVPIALIPDTKLPIGMQMDFQELTEKVGVGEITIGNELNEQGLNQVVNALSQNAEMGVESLETEIGDIQHMLHKLPREGKHPKARNILEVLEEASVPTAELFSKRQRDRKVGSKVLQLLNRLR